MTIKVVPCCVERERKKEEQRKLLLTNIFDYSHFLTLIRSVKHSSLII